MRNPNYIVAFATLLLLSACDLPTAVWTKPGVSQAQYSADTTDCEQQMNAANFGVGPATGANKKNYYERCMIDRGYAKEEELSGTHLHNPQGVLEQSR